MDAVRSGILEHGNILLKRTRSQPAYRRLAHHGTKAMQALEEEGVVTRPRLRYANQ
ncbi:hypothetical protein KCP78_10055 [Salmonella enterica subsp. enterica]|nr:hypothetical protein KCP78_10055 [Salmonella enterica subsp. enterica]